MHLQSKFAQKRQEEKKDRKCRKSVTTQIGNFFFHYLFGNSFPQITNQKLYQMKGALVPTLLVAQLKTHNRTMAIISKFCPKIRRVFTKNALFACF